MNRSARWPRILVIVGLVAMLAGILDLMEGSLVILAGIALVTFGAWLGHGRQEKLLYWAFALVVFGVGALWALSSVGGFGGNSGRSNWWGLLILPYPVGWIMGLLAVRRILRRPSTGGEQLAT
ncbi:MAG: hypothetical protein WEA80_03065 [Gemmatimonadaceae bacterium]